MKAAQVGATEAGNNWIGFVVHQAPGPMLAVQPTVELAKRNSRQRIDPLIEESPELREMVRPARSRDAGNTMLSKEFAGGILIMTGANSAVGLRSTPARYIFLDEVDAYPASADEEGDPVTLADPNVGRDAVYIADGGAPVLVRAVARRADAITDFGDARLWSETTRIDLRVAEVANPRPGDRIEIDGDAFLIQGEPVRDRERLVWTVDLRPA